MHILVTSPIPSHPQNHGNRARVTALCRALQKLGAEIHYVYGGLEDLPRRQELAMREAWEHVHILPPYRAHKHMGDVGKMGIDDWYVDGVSRVTERIMKIWRIDYCIANYVWFSRWLDMVPADIPKYIDTHDVFADRHQRLIADGHQPSWYSTSRSEETKGLDRADAVIAIQNEEADQFKERTRADVVTLGHFIETDFLTHRQGTPGSKMTVGYMASDNPINQQSLRAMNRAIENRRDALSNIEFVLAGGICASPSAVDTPFRKLGFVEDARAFYQSMDLIINPNAGGTGLKIKSIEALAYGKALVATEDAMAGIESNLPAHGLKDAEAICDHLTNIDAETIAQYEEDARRIADSYVAQQDAAMRALFPTLFNGSIDPQSGDFQSGGVS